MRSVIGGIARAKGSPKKLRRISKGFEEFRGGFEGFEGMSHDNYPPFKVVSTRHDECAKIKKDWQARIECSRS